MGFDKQKLNGIPTDGWVFNPKTLKTITSSDLFISSPFHTFILHPTKRTSHQKKVQKVTAFSDLLSQKKTTKL